MLFAEIDETIRGKNDQLNSNKEVEIIYVPKNKYQTNIPTEYRMRFQCNKQGTYICGVYIPTSSLRNGKLNVFKILQTSSLLCAYLSTFRIVLVLFIISQLLYHFSLQFLFLRLSLPFIYWTGECATVRIGRSFGRCICIQWIQWEKRIRMRRVIGFRFKIKYKFFFVCYVCTKRLSYG